MAIIRNLSPSDQRVVGTNGGDAIDTGTGNDTIFGGDGLDIIFASGGQDILFGQDGNDFINGVSGNDTIFGGLGSDLIRGNTGNDTLAVETGFSDFGTDVLDGFSGFDKIVFQTASIIEVNGNPTQAVALEATRGVSVNLINAFRPGLVGDFTLIADDEAGEDVSAFVTRQRGQILDATSLGSGGAPNGVTDLIDDPSAVFADVEEFVLTGFGDFLLDSDASHIVTGGGGDDFISGGGGFDVLDGGEGKDTALYRGSDAAVSVVLLDFGSGGSGSGGDATGDKLFDIENVHGSNFGDFVLGDANGNALRGFDGNDTLVGGAGTDTVSSGNGGDTLRGGLGNDVVLGGEGVDTALFQDWNGYNAPRGSLLRGTIALADGDNAGSASVTRTARFGRLGAEAVLETDTLTGIENVTASNVSETISGNGAGNVLDGRGGNDVIDGGRGSDTLKGGEGIDTASFASFGARAAFATVFSGVEASLATGQARATIRSFVNPGTIVDADTFSGFENLTGSKRQDHLTGDGAVNTLNGLDAADVLTGLGGADRLVGGLGNDTLTGGSGADTLIGGDGVGDVASYELEDAVDIDLSTASFGGAAAGDSLVQIEIIRGSGNGNDTIGAGATGMTFLGLGGGDRLRGGGGGDSLDGGTGIDTMTGGGSDDTFVVDAAGDVVVEFADDGIDTIRSTVTRSLEANVENLTLIGNVNINGAGNGLDNKVIGNSNGNVLFGGLGNDTLTGGAGVDNFFFQTAPDSIANVDAITDFTVIDDRIVLGSGAFAGLSPGPLAAGAFNTGAAATEADDRIVFDAATGNLIFDADGSGAGEAILFAVLQSVTGTVSHDDFTVA